jgi:Zn-dependent peptidase ImmA (M78 family)
MLSEFELVQLASPDKTDAVLVTDLVRNTLDDLDLSPPVNHDIVASYRGVVRIDYADLPWSGHIAATDAGLVIGVRASDPSRRQRFTIFHEVLHTYMRGFRLQPQYRCDPGAEPVEIPCDAALERLCDQGAAELLLPSAELLDDLAGKVVNLDLVDALAEEYEASRAATASRICAVNPTKTAFLILEVATKPRDPSG